MLEYTWKPRKTLINSGSTVTIRDLNKNVITPPQAPVIVGGNVTVYVAKEGRYYVTITSQTSSTTHPIDINDPDNDEKPSLDVTELDATYVKKVDALSSNWPDLLSKAFDSTLYAAHRVGGGFVFPENSMEGIEYTFRHGFAAEIDIQPLSDGTLVLCHDSTADRTISGVTGNLTSINPQQWKDARLKAILPGGIKYLPPFWEDVLDRFGGRGIFLAEIKTNDNTAAQKIIDSVVNRGLKNSIMILTFNSTHAQMAASAGLKVTFISDSVTPSTAKTWGIVGLTCSQNGTQSYVQSITAAGLIPGVYGISTAAEAATRVSWGAKTITSDDPWLITDRYTKIDKDPFDSMNSWVGYRSTAASSFKYRPKPDGSIALYMSGNPGIRMPWSGGIPTNSRVLATWRFGSTGIGQGSARLYFGTTKDLHGTAAESVTNNYYMVMVRRSGELAAYKKVGGTSTQLTGTGATNPVFPVLSDGTAGSDIQLQIDILPSGIEVTNLGTGNKLTFSDTSLTGPYYLNASLGGGAPQPEAEIRNIMRYDL